MLKTEMLGKETINSRLNNILEQHHQEQLQSSTTSHKDTSTEVHPKHEIWRRDSYETIIDGVCNHLPDAFKIVKKCPLICVYHRCLMLSEKSIR